MLGVARSPSLKTVCDMQEGHKDNLNKIRKLTEHLDSVCVVEADLINFWRLSPDMFVVASTDGKFLEVNDSWVRILGWTKDELLRSSWFDFIHPNDIRPTREVVGHMTTNTLTRFHNRYRKKLGGYLCLEWSATQWHDNKCYAVARPIPMVCCSCPESAARFGFEMGIHVEHK